MNLADRHEAKPTHSLAEINYLHEQFPKEIFMIAARVGDVLVAGNVFTTEGPVLQGRYTASNEAGRKACASDLVVEHGIAAARERGCQFYSMGTSTLDAGRQLNEPGCQFQDLVRGAPALSTRPANWICTASRRPRHTCLTCGVAPFLTDSSGLASQVRMVAS